MKYFCIILTILIIRVESYSFFGGSLMNNTWNKIIYKLWAPVYDVIFNAGYLLEARKKVFQGMAFTPQQKILVVGVGTGAELELLYHEGLAITAIDYSPSMLNKARQKFSTSSITFIEMDAQELKFPNAQFDLVIGILILSVVPNPDACLKEMARVIKPGGEILLFDKFLPAAHHLSVPKKIIRPAIKLLGTDIGLNFEKLFEHHKGSLLIKEDLPILFNGMYRKILLSKQA